MPTLLTRARLIRTPGRDYLALLPPGPDAVRELPLHGAWPGATVPLGLVPDDARRALLTRFFDHAPMFPPASLSLAEALAEDLARARPNTRGCSRASSSRRRKPPGCRRTEARAVAARRVGLRASGRRSVFVEGVPLDEVAARGLRAKIRCGGARVPTVEELAAFVRGPRLARARLQGDGGASITPIRRRRPASTASSTCSRPPSSATRKRRCASGRPRSRSTPRSFRWGDREALPTRLADVRALALPLDRLAARSSSPSMSSNGWGSCELRRRQDRDRPGGTATRSSICRGSATSSRGRRSTP